MNLSQIEFRKSDGQTARLADYTGKVVLIVNVASKCGLTPQYEGLEKLYETYGEKGLVVLGFPANEFGAQEPGSNAEIQEFCTLNYGVKFPVLEKIVVKGPGQHPLYKTLTSTIPLATKKDNTFEKKLADYGIPAAGPGEITWNFEKFLINRKGEIAKRFAPDISPEDPMIVEAIKAELAK